MTSEFDTLLCLFAFLYLYFFFLVPSVYLISTYYVYDPIPSISGAWENYISQWAIFRWPAYMLLAIKKWHDDWHVRQSERLGHWKFMYMPTIILGAVTALQLMSGSPIPVTYVIGHRMYPAFHDGDVVLMSARRAPRVGDSVLYLNTSISYSLLSSKIPVITASEDDALQIRRIKEIQDSLYFEEGTLQNTSPHTLMLCAAGGNVSQEVCGEVPWMNVVGVVTLRVPWAALPLRFVQKLGSFLESHTRIGQPGSLWEIIDKALTEGSAVTNVARALFNYLGELEVPIKPKPTKGLLMPKPPMKGLPMQNPPTDNFTQDTENSDPNF